MTAIGHSRNFVLPGKRLRERRGALVIRDLDEVLVGIADVDRLDRADGAGARPRPGDDRHPAALQMGDEFGQRHLGDEAQIAGARGRLVGDQPRDVVSRVQVDLLLAETQRRPPFAEMHDLHAEHPRVEGAGSLDVGDGQDEVIETRDVHCRPRFALSLVEQMRHVLHAAADKGHHGETDQQQKKHGAHAG